MVVVRDLYGNLRSGDDELIATLTPFNASFSRLAVEPLDAVVGNVENVGIGYYRVTYNTTVRGTHQLDVLLSVVGGAAEPISGSPWFPYTHVRCCDCSLHAACPCTAVLGFCLLVDASSESATLKGGQPCLAGVSW
jgi:hypothetical protein